MKKIVDLLSVLAIGTAVLFFTACGGSDENPGNTAMGRYVETTLEYPMETMSGQHLTREGAILALGMDETGNQRLYESKDGENWTERMLPWQEYRETVSADHFDLSVGRDGNLYVKALNYSSVNDTYSVQTNIYKVGTAGLELIPIDWQTAPDNPYGVDVYNFSVMGSGDIVVDQSYDGLYFYGKDGKFKRSFGDERLDHSSFTISENELYLLDLDSNAVLVYDGESGALSRTVPFESGTRNTGLYTGQNGAVYLQNSNGLFRLLAGGSVWEKIIDGDLNSMAMPSYYFYNLLETQDGVFYLLAADSGSGTSKLLRYDYDETIAAMPAQELVVYTLEENSTLRQAVGAFQRQHPDTKVNIQIADLSGSASKADVLRALNTEILGGGGPDLIILDGMNVNSYIEKGVLEDISDIIEAALKSSNLLEKVVRAYEKDGKAYTATTKFYLPVLYTDKEKAPFMGNLKDTAAYAQANPEIGLMGALTADAALELFLPTCAPAWIGSGNIDEELLREFLESMMAILEVPAGSMEFEDLNGYDSSMEVFHWAYGRSHMAAVQLRGLGDGITQELARRIRDGIAVHMPGQVEKAFIPSGVIGINVNSTKKDAAKDLILTMLSEEVQNNALRDGLPVNIDALSDIKVMEDAVFGTSNTLLEGEDLSGEPPFREEQEALLELALTVETPSAIDDQLISIITEESMGYFNGSKTIDQAVADIVEKTRLYLAE